MLADEGRCCFKEFLIFILGLSNFKTNNLIEKCSQISLMVTGEDVISFTFLNLTGWKEL